MEVKTREFLSGRWVARRSAKAIVLGADAPHWYQTPHPSLSFTIAVGPLDGYG